MTKAAAQVRGFVHFHNLSISCSDSLVSLHISFTGYPSAFIVRAIAFRSSLILTFIYCRYLAYSAFHFRPDMQRLQALTFIPKTEQNVVVIFVLYKWKTDNVMFIIVWRKIFIRTKVKDSVHHRFMNTDFYFLFVSFLKFPQSLDSVF